MVILYQRAQLMSVAQVLVDRASERVEGTLTTREDFEIFG